MGPEDHHVRPTPVHPHAIVDCENLLESYLMQVALQLVAPFGSPCEGKLQLQRALGLCQW